MNFSLNVHSLKANIIGRFELPITDACHFTYFGAFVSQIPCMYMYNTLLTSETNSHGMFHQ